MLNVNYINPLRNDTQSTLSKEMLNLEDCYFLSKWKSILERKIIKYYKFNEFDKHFEFISLQTCTKIIDISLKNYTREYSKLIKKKLDMNKYSYFNSIFVGRGSKDFGINIRLNKNEKIHIIGDIHSSIHSVVDILSDLYDKGIMNDNFQLSNDNCLIFLGDIVDRGPYSVESLILILIIKIVNNDSVWILNGNHENRLYYNKLSKQFINFKQEFEAYNYQGNNDMNNIITRNTNINKLFDEILLWLPTVLFAKHDDKIYQFNHGAFESSFNLDPDAPIFYLENIHKDPAKIQLNANRGFKFGDFYGKDDGPNTLDGDKIVRPIKTRKQLLEYNRKNQIKTIISGHQDTINFGFIPYDRNYIDKYNYGVDKNVNYLYRPLDEHEGEKMIDLNNIASIVTSTCIIPKPQNMKFSTYLTLSKTNHKRSLDMINSDNKKYKYKQKYLETKLEYLETKKKRNGLV